MKREPFTDADKQEIYPAPFTDSDKQEIEFYITDESHFVLLYHDPDGRKRTVSSPVSSARELARAVVRMVDKHEAKHGR